MIEEMYKSLPIPREGHIGKYKNTMNTIINILKKYKPKISAQTGLNAGHSAILILESCDTKLYSFDIGSWEYVLTAVEVIDKYFPNRHFYIEGNSIKTLREFNQKIDFAFVDGGHDFTTAHNDIINFDRVLNQNGLMLVDNTNTYTVKRAINSFSFKNYTEINLEEFGKYDGGALYIKDKK